MLHERLRVIVAPAALMALMAGLPAGCGKQEPPPAAQPAGEETASSWGPSVVARAGEVELTAEKFRTYLYESSRRKPGDLGYEQREMALRQYLVRAALAAEGRRMGGEGDSEVRKSLNIWKLRNYPDFYNSSQVDPLVEVTEEDLWEYIKPEEMFHLAAAVFPLSEEGKEEAEEVRKLLMEGADFAETAKERSHGLLAEKGGDMAWQVIPNFSVDETATEAIRLLSPGEYTLPLSTEVGWIIYYLKDYISAQEEFEKRREAKRPEVLSGKTAAARKRKLAELREKADLVIHPPEKVAEGAPFAVVNGVSIMPEILDSMHGGGRSVYTIEQRLYQYIDALLIVQEVERLGLDKEGSLASTLDYVMTKKLSEFAVARAVEEKIDVTEEEMEAEYKRTYLPEAYQLQIVKTTEREAAEKALAELEGGRDFGEVSGSYSQGGDLAEKKGILPERTLADLPADLRSEIAGLADGERTGIVAGEGIAGHLIIKRISMRTLEMPPYEQVKEKVRKNLHLKERSTLAREFMRDFSGSLDVEINEELLGSL